MKTNAKNSVFEKATDAAGSKIYLDRIAGASPQQKPFQAYSL